MDARLIDGQARVGRRQRVDGRGGVVAAVEGRVGRGAARPPPLLVAGAFVARRAGGHGGVGDMGRRTSPRGGMVRDVAALRDGLGVPGRILVEIDAVLGQVGGRGLPARRRVHPGEGVDGDGGLGVRGQALERDGGDDARGHGEAGGVGVLAHVEGLHGRPLGVPRGAGAGRAARGRGRLPPIVVGGAVLVQLPPEERLAARRLSRFVGRGRRGAGHRGGRR